MDPKWLYATIITASATVVAIVGGFITSSAIALRIERENIIRDFQMQEQLKHTLGQQRLDLTYRINRAQSEGDARLLEKLSDTSDEMDREIEIAEAKSELYLQQTAIESNLDFTWGERALSFLALVGIVLPLILLPQESENYETWHRRVVTGLFVVGLLGVITYIVRVTWHPWQRMGISRPRINPPLRRRIEEKRRSGKWD